MKDVSKLSEQESRRYIEAAKKAARKADEAIAARDQAIADAMNNDVSPTLLSKELDMHRTRVYQIKRDAKK